MAGAVSRDSGEQFLCGYHQKTRNQNLYKTYSSEFEVHEKQKKNFMKTLYFVSLQKWRTLYLLTLGRLNHVAHTKRCAIEFSTKHIPQIFELYYKQKIIYENIFWLLFYNNGGYLTNEMR